MCSVPAVKSFTECPFAAWTFSGSPNSGSPWSRAPPAIQTRRMRGRLPNGEVVEYHRGALAIEPGSGQCKTPFISFSEL
jgi:hypothetical protein